MPDDGNTICCHLQCTMIRLVVCTRLQHPSTISHKLKGMLSLQKGLRTAPIHLQIRLSLEDCLANHLNIKFHKGCTGFCSCVEGMDGILSITHQGAATIC